VGIVFSGCGEPDAELVGLCLTVLRVCAFEEPDSDFAEPAGENSAGGRDSGGGGDCGVADNSVHCVSSDDVGHFVSEDEGDLVGVGFAELDERASNKYKPSGQGKGVGFASLYGLEAESPEFVCDAGGQARSDPAEQMLGFGVGVWFKLLPDLVCEVSSDVIFDLYGVGLGTCH